MRDSCLCGLVHINLVITKLKIDDCHLVKATSSVVLFYLLSLTKPNSVFKLMVRCKASVKASFPRAVLPKQSTIQKRYGNV